LAGEIPFGWTGNGWFACLLEDNVSCRNTKERRSTEKGDKW
jgi:hypothetical protein